MLQRFFALPVILTQNEEAAVAMFALKGRGFGGFQISPLRRKAWESLFNALLELPVRARKEICLQTLKSSSNQA